MTGRTPVGPGRGTRGRWLAGRIVAALADLVAIAGAGGVIAFFMTSWWLSPLSPVPWIGRHGAVATAAACGLVGFLLGARSGRPARGLAHLAASAALGAAGLAAVLMAPERAGVSLDGNMASLFAAQRVVVSLFFSVPAGLLGAAAGAAVSPRP